MDRDSASSKALKYPLPHSNQTFEAVALHFTDGGMEAQRGE